MSMALVENFNGQAPARKLEEMVALLGVGRETVLGNARVLKREKRSAADEARSHRTHV